MGQIMTDVHGQHVVMPFDDATGQTTGRELREHANIQTGRQVTVTGPDGATQVVPDHARINLQPGSRVSDVPGQFRYGTQAWYGPIPPTARRLQLEADYITYAFHQRYPCEFGLDDNVDGSGTQRFGRWWVMVYEFPLPAGRWNMAQTAILVTVKDSYPQTYPDGFWLNESLRDRHGHTPGHYFEKNIHRGSELARKGWAWYCIHPAAWAPTVDIRMGDSIYKYLTLISLVMSGDRR